MHGIRITDEAGDTYVAAPPQKHLFVCYGMEDISLGARMGDLGFLPFAVKAPESIEVN